MENQISNSSCGTSLGEQLWPETEAATYGKPDFKQLLRDQSGRAAVARNRGGHLWKTEFQTAPAGPVWASSCGQKQRRPPMENRISNSSCGTSLGEQLWPETEAAT